jgi:hypothetical protein
MSEARELATAFTPVPKLAELTLKMEQICSSETLLDSQ